MLSALPVQHVLGLEARQHAGAVDHGRGLGGALETGRTLDYTSKSDDQRKLCSLYLGIMDRMGVNLPEFGDADTRLSLL